MNISTKLLKAAAGSAGGGATTDVTDVFSTFVWGGSGAKVQKIENGVQLGAASTDNVALHMTGATSTDNGPLSLTVNAIGNATTSTTQTKFTSKSLYVDGTGSGDSGTCFDIQEGQIKLAKKDFTIEYWVYWNTLPTYSDFASRNYYVNGYDGSFGGGYSSTSGGQLRIFAYDDQTFLGSVTGSVSVSTGTWYHVAISRSNGTAYLFLDGTLKGSGAFDHDLKNAEIGGITIGRLSGYEQVNAYFSDFRITVGAARYTSSFTAPSAALPVDSGTSGEGGLVWIKSRTNPGTGHFHHLVDSERGQSSGFHKALYSNGTEAENQYPSSSNGGVSSFNSNGFTVGPGSNSNHFLNASGYNYVSWTFRKAPKFFDVVTYSSNQSSSQTINHNLGSVPGMIMVKRTSASANWAVYHRGADSSNPEQYALNLNTTGVRNQGTSFWNDTAPTSTQFTVGNNALTNDSDAADYVAYLFAHNNNDGEFGPDGDADIIKCGSLTISSQATVEVNLGFEAQWVMLKRSSGTGNWFMFDVMRGMAVSGFEWIYANDSNAAEVKSYQAVFPTATGFSFNPANNGQLTDGDYIYMAIRRGPLAVPTDATKVFEATTSLTGARQNGDTISTTLDYADWHFFRRTDRTDYNSNNARITGWKYLSTNTTDAETTAVLKQGGDQNKLEYTSSWHGAHSSVIDYFFKRAPSFFDVVAWTGTGSNMNISHNLGVVPEMIWARPRSYADNWSVFHKDLTYNVRLNDNSAMGTGQVFGTLTSSVMPTASGSIHASGQTYIAYLFATVAGVSKVGSVAPTGSALTVDCGFTSGARFVLMKRTDSTGEWFVWDSVRGIVSGNDPWLALNSTSSETTNTDYIDPHSSGFALTSSFYGSGSNFIFYAIA